MNCFLNMHNEVHSYVLTHLLFDQLSSSHDEATTIIYNIIIIYTRELHVSFLSQHTKYVFLNDKSLSTVYNEIYIKILYDLL